MAEKAILYDATKCTGCRGCQVACKAWNDLEAEETTNSGTYENPPDLSPNTWLKMQFEEVVDTDAPGGLSWLFTRRACMHCSDAGCVKVCPTGALHYHELGFVAYDKDNAVSAFPTGALFVPLCSGPERFICGCVQTAELSDHILATYRWFTTSRALLDAIVYRWAPDTPDTPGMRVLRLRLLDFMRRWVEKHWYQFDGSEGEQCVVALLTFLHGKF